VSRADARPKRVDRHHEGFFARVSVGGGWQRLLAPDRGHELRVSGATMSVQGDLGLSVERNLVLHLTGHYWQMVNPRFRIDDAPSRVGRAGSIVVGPGLTYYFMPVNIYLSGALGLGFMFMDKPVGVTTPGKDKRFFWSDGGLGAAGERWQGVLGGPRVGRGDRGLLLAVELPRAGQPPGLGGAGLRPEAVGDLRLILGRRRRRVRRCRGARTKALKIPAVRDEAWRVFHA
jgi:hypothetical protein